MTEVFKHLNKVADHLQDELERSKAIKSHEYMEVVIYCLKVNRVVTELLKQFMEIK